ncbi:hypothetical protein HDU96_007321 [Phlyctochytrium bullatum]|nr:hypothetical protein HDU96_007321 [Phlyctochytrium bullatum]
MHVPVVFSGGAASRTERAGTAVLAREMTWRDVEESIQCALDPHTRATIRTLHLCERLPPAATASTSTAPAASPRVRRLWEVSVADARADAEMGRALGESLVDAVAEAGARGVEVVVEAVVEETEVGEAWDEGREVQGDEEMEEGGEDGDREEEDGETEEDDGGRRETNVGRMRFVRDHPDGDSSTAGGVVAARSSRSAALPPILPDATSPVPTTARDKNDADNLTHNAFLCSNDDMVGQYVGARATPTPFPWVSRERFLGSKDAHVDVMAAMTGWGVVLDPAVKGGKPRPLPESGDEEARRAVLRRQLEAVCREEVVGGSGGRRARAVGCVGEGGVGGGVGMHVAGLC